VKLPDNREYLPMIMVLLLMLLLLSMWLQEWGFIVLVFYSHLNYHHRQYRYRQSNVRYYSHSVACTYSVSISHNIVGRRLKVF
jgi:hypothetical protein